jgi:hypothetical protein
VRESHLIRRLGEDPRASRMDLCWTAWENTFAD